MRSHGGSWCDSNSHLQLYSGLRNYNNITTDRMSRHEHYSVLTNIFAIDAYAKDWQLATRAQES